jgi:hypothetical protein
MSISGPQALVALDEALRDIRREEDEILRKLIRGLDRAAKLRDGESELLRQLAEGRLPAEAAQALSAEVLSAGTIAHETLKRRVGEMTGLMAQLRQLEASIVERTADRATMLGNVDQHQASLRALAPRIAAAVARAPEYEQQRQLALGLKAIAAAARAKSGQAAFEREQKGRPFHDDALFSYLLERGFGTPAYRGRGLTAALDSWVARLIHFSSATLHYATLNALPPQLDAHAEQQARQAAAAEDRLDELEHAAIDTAGGHETRRLLAAAQVRIAAIDAELTTCEAQRDKTVAAQTQLASIEEAGFGLACQPLVEALGGRDLISLIAALRAGASGGDSFAAQLDDLRLRLAEEETDGRDLNARLATLADRRRDLQVIEADLKHRHFDDPRSLFRDPALIAAGLDRFLIGATAAPAYLAQWHQSQAWIAGTSDWGGRIGLPRRGPVPVDPTAPEPSSASAKDWTATELSS